MRALLIGSLFGAAVDACVVPRGSNSFADMHDGDVKNITFSKSSHGQQMTISQNAPVEWSLTTDLSDDCVATVDFSKSKKPDHPPVPLQVRIKQTTRATFLVEFTDPSGTLNPDTEYPLNLWTTEQESPAQDCVQFPVMPFQDMHDGDVKTVSLAKGVLSLGQQGVWNLSTPLDPKTCKATVDFSKSSKPAKPPVPLVVSVSSTKGAPDGSIIMTWTDPTKTISPSASFPLNIWESVSGRFRSS